MSKNIWLIPIHYPDILHWVLAVVLVQEKVIVFFDSMIQEPKPEVINGIFTVIKTLTNKQVKVSEWRVYAPSDIPKQSTDGKVLSGNCGVHVSSWGLTLATCSFFPFTEFDMPQARRSIAHIVYYSKDNIIRNEKAEKVNTTSRERTRNVRLSEFEIPISRSPPFDFDTTFDFCSALNLLVEEKKNTRNS